MTLTMTGATELWAFPLDRAPAADPGDEARARAARFVDPLDARRFLNSRAWIAHLLHGRDPVHASWSRSGNAGVLAYDERQRPGVDLEALRPVEHMPQLALDHLDPASREAIWRAADPDAAFLAAWTALEARGKAGGTGLAVLPPPALPVAAFRIERNATIYVGSLANPAGNIQPRWADEPGLETI